MKGLLFLSAGSVVHGTNTRDLERMGGLLKSMPWTGGAMVFGAVAIAGLPPLNGFLGEWLIYIGLIDGGMMPGAAGVASFLATGLLATIGALAALCFIRLIGIALLGAARSSAAEHSHESSVEILGPILVLALLSTLVALAPVPFVEISASAASSALGGIGGIQELGRAPLDTLGLVNGAICGAVALALGVLMIFQRNRTIESGPTWGCGYARATPRIQYTARSFSEFVAERLLPRRLRPMIVKSPPAGLFPKHADFASDTADPLTRRLYEPFWERWAGFFSRLRWLQQGMLHLYLLYIVLFVVAALAWLSFRDWLTP
jgi:NADH:ubiquinone oxidoreductase subunit 5 (subunit L)/multisubunit Na+/H+ antiporter MnhA subunit